MGGVTIIEVDHPATQASKRQRIDMAGLVTPPNLHFCPMDFERDDLETALKGASHDPSLRTFFSWLGVTQYLTRPAIERTLTSIRDASAAGSEIVFTYLDEKFLLPENQTPEMREVMDRAAAGGEPQITGFAPATLASQLTPFGFELDENLEVAQQAERYFLNRMDGLKPAGRMVFAHAVAV